MLPSPNPNSFDHDLDLEHAASVSGRALSLMAELGIPVTPANFTVWFAYVLGRSAALRKTIDIVRSNKRKFDKALNRELYGMFLKAHNLSDGEQTVSEELGAILANVSKDLSGAIADNAAHVEELSQVGRSVGAAGDVALAFKRLAEELSKATTRASALETRLAEASGELSTLRTSLREAEVRSLTDGLTGLANRRAMEMFLQSAQINAMESGEPLSIFLVDVDHFKKFNDRYGHQVGDQVLRLVSSCLQEGVRSSDLAARYGGEELMCVLPQASLDVGREIAERIRTRIAEARMTRRATGEEIGQITISAGVAQFKPGESFETLIERCDSALYAAKQSGRNRTVVAASG